MELIETEMAEIALCNLAKYLPKALEEMYRNNPMELEKEVQSKKQ